VVKSAKTLHRFTNLAAAIHMLRARKITLLDPNTWDDKNDAYFMAEYKRQKGLATLLALCFADCDETYHHWRVFARDVLPEHLRGVHDQIIEIRNKRFAHNDDHHSVTNDLGVEFDGSRFFLKFNLTLGYHVGGATEWHELTAFLDRYTVERMEKVLARLKQKTGYEWIMPTGPAPD
jgi:hypothetical protein